MIQLTIYLPLKMKNKLERAAIENKRSLTKEIETRLERDIQREVSDE